MPRRPRNLSQCLPDALLPGAALALLLLALPAASAPADPDCPDPSNWQRPDKAELRERLTPLQYRVTQRNGTEPPFRNAYWDNKGEGIYVDVVSGEPLFSSREKFRSGTGWPSFHTPLEPALIVEHTDRSHGMRRVEVRSRNGDSHLGHVFNDGPEPTGLRYCINSAALRFIPVAELEQEGYGAYKALFADGAAASARVRCAGD